MHRYLSQYWQESKGQEFEFYEKIFKEIKAKNPLVLKTFYQ